MYMLLVSGRDAHRSTPSTLQVCPGSDNIAGISDYYYDPESDKLLFVHIR